MTRLLITGIAGFIGFSLAKTLVQKDIQIVGIDNLNKYYDQHLKYDRLKELGFIDSDGFTKKKAFNSSKWGNLMFIKIDLSSTTDIDELFDNYQFDYVIHLGAQAGVR